MLTLKVKKEVDGIHISIIELKVIHQVRKNSTIV